MGHSAEKNSRAEFFNTCCVSVNPNCTAASSVALRQSQHEVSDDVALNFGCAGFDGIAPRPQVRVGPLAIVESAVARSRQLAIRAEHFHGDLLQALVQL